MPPNSRSNLWEKPDTESRNLHTIGEFFPLLIQLFSILNICSALIPFLPQQPPRLQVRVEYSGSSRATPRGTHQRGDQPQARNPQKLRELHFADPGKTQLLAA